MASLRSLCAFLKTLRVEPVLFLFYLAYIFSNFGSTTLSTQKLCFPEGPPGVSVICKSSESLKEAADLNEVRGILRGCLPALVVIFFGSWRDVTHRHLPIMIICFIGEFVAAGLELASSLAWNVSPWLFVGMSCFIGGFCGSNTTVSMCSLSYIAQKATPEERAMRIPIVMIATLGAVCIATTVAGYVLTTVDYLAYYIGILVIYGFGLVIAVLIIKDTPTKASGGYLQSAKNLRIVFRSRPNSFQIWIFIVASALITSMLNAESTVTNLFLQRKFQTTPSMSGLLGGYKMLMSLLTAGIATPLLKRWFKLSDFVILAICVVPSVISCFGMAFADSLTQIYIFATLDLLRITFISTLTNIFTGCINKTEIGVFSSFLAFGEGILPLALNPLYVYVFKMNVDTLPGAFYCISGCSIILSGLLVWIASISYKPYEEAEYEIDNKEEMHASREDTGGVDNLAFDTVTTYADLQNA